VSAALALIQDNRSAAFYVGGSLQRAFNRFKGTTKIVAKTANANERSSENWLQARVCPDVPHFLRLAMQVPELKSAVLWLLNHGMEHPDAAPLLGKIERYLDARPESGDQRT